MKLIFTQPHMYFICSTALGPFSENTRITDLSLHCYVRNFIFVGMVRRMPFSKERE